MVSECCTRCDPPSALNNPQPPAFSLHSIFESILAWPDAARGDPVVPVSAVERRIVETIAHRSSLLTKKLRRPKTAAPSALGYIAPTSVRERRPGPRPKVSPCGSLRAHPGQWPVERSVHDTGDPDSGPLLDTPPAFSRRRPARSPSQSRAGKTRALTGEPLCMARGLFGWNTRFIGKGMVGLCGFDPAMADAVLIRRPAVHLRPCTLECGVDRQPGRL